MNKVFLFGCIWMLLLGSVWLAQLIVNFTVLLKRYTYRGQEYTGYQCLQILGQNDVPKADRDAIKRFVADGQDKIKKCALIFISLFGLCFIMYIATYLYYINRIRFSNGWVYLLGISILLGLEFTSIHMTDTLKNNTLFNTEPYEFSHLLNTYDPDALNNSKKNAESAQRLGFRMNIVACVWLVISVVSLSWVMIYENRRGAMPIGPPR